MGEGVVKSQKEICFVKSELLQFRYPVRVSMVCAAYGLFGLIFTVKVYVSISLCSVNPIINFLEKCRVEDEMRILLRKEGEDRFPGKKEIMSYLELCFFQSSPF